MSTFNFPGFSDPKPSDVGFRMPTACPTCHSALIITTSKHPDDTSYWRCRDCGEVWNVARRRDQAARGRWR